ncbi:MAG: hypothetical protein M1823_005346 [Watsoniomyces obsoletus]|nr:MAG: hypothetical protein M1823_005346 [Watsoniomyces obsoletus]
MATINFLDQDFGAESDDDTNFNPAPPDDSDNENDGEEEDEVAESTNKANGQRKKSTTPAASKNVDKDDGDANDENAADEEDGEDGEDEGEGDEEDDEEDEDEDEDEEEVKGHRRKRRKERGVQGLFDMEAMVDDDEEEMDDEEDELKEAEGFIADIHPDDVGDLPSGRAGDDRRHRELDRRREIEASLDAEKQAELLRQRYGRSRAAATDSIVVPKRLLLPGVDDPSIWGVKCRPGKEREAVFSIMKRAEEYARSGQTFPITGAFERRGMMEGYVYIEAKRQGDVLTALEGISNVYARSTIVLVPIKEMPDLLRTKKSKTVKDGDYVRIKRGVYQGDLAIVDEVEDSGLEYFVRLVPRLNYGLDEDLNAPTPAAPPPGSAAAAAMAGKRKRLGPPRPTAANRPPPRLFSEADARKKHAKFLKRGVEPNTWIYLNETYTDGFLIKVFKLQQIQTEDVKPTLEEITRFAGGTEDGMDNIDLGALATTLKAGAGGIAYTPGDDVEVYEGEQRGLRGRVVSANVDFVSFTVDAGELRGHIMEVPFRTVRKRFQAGDHVKVVGGSTFRDEVGMIVKITGDRVTMLSDLSLQEVTVFSRDVRKSMETGGLGSLGKFDLFDLVQLDPATVAVIVKIDREYLQVLDQNGSKRSVMPSQIAQKLDRRRHAVATDRNGSEIRVEDTVREVGGEGKQGKIMHIHRAFVFVHSREHRDENGGIFVTRTTNVATVAAKGARMANGVDLSKMNPAVQLNGTGGAGAGGSNGSMPPPATRSVGRDKLIGKTVVIRRGEMKGLLGIVKDTNDAIAVVELHSRPGKALQMVPKEALAIKDPYTGQTIAFRDGPAGRGRGMGGSGGMGRGMGMGMGMGGGSGGYGGGGDRGPSSYGGGTPNRRPDDNWTGSRTPMAAQQLDPMQGGRTPAWGGGARTPAWRQQRTQELPPARTPSWRQGDRGGADGSATVNPYMSSGRASYGSGSKTPSWTAGNSTPLGRDRGFGGSSGNGGFNDSFDAGNRTPAYGMSGNNDDSWGAGSATPMYTGGSDMNEGRGGGSMTPAWSGGSNIGGAQLSTFGAPTPGASSYNALTPGGFAAGTPARPMDADVDADADADWGGGDEESHAGDGDNVIAPTPGATGGGDGSGGVRDGGAPTPGAMGGADMDLEGEEDDQPRYATPSP